MQRIEFDGQVEIAVSSSQKIVITNAPSLDPITVHIDDIAPGRGHITISCYGKAWTAYWGGMGGLNISKFFTTTSKDYILNCMRVMVAGREQKHADEYLSRIIVAVQNALKVLEAPKEET